MAEQAHLTSKSKAVLRLHPSIIESWSDSVMKDLFQKYTQLENTLDSTTELRADLRLLSDSEDSPPWLREIAKSLSKDRSVKTFIHPEGGIVLIGSRRLRHDQNDFTDEDDSSSSTVPVLLTQHCRSVGQQVEVFGNSIGLSRTICSDLYLAGCFHDIGKADPRFQILLQGGDRWKAMASDLLAKSDGVPFTLQRFNEVRRLSGYPRGGRHELLSIRLFESAPDLLDQADDIELVLHLIASHHGRCRPFAPVIEDMHPVEVTLDLDGQTLKTMSDTDLERFDSGVAERFWRLVRRYGWWGLASLEAIIRLADHRVSAQEIINRKEDETWRVDST